MNAWNTILIIAGSLLLIVLCRKEIMRRNKERLVWRITATMISVICLVCLGLPLTMKRSLSATGEVILLTRGADKNTVQDFNKNKKLTVQSIEEFLSAEKNTYDSIHVFGYGLSADELKQAGGAKIIFHPSPVAAGITSINWNRKIKKGEKILVQGTYTNSTSSAVTLLLNGFNTTLDSFKLSPGKIQIFQLQTVPKQNGRAVYSVFALHGKDTLEKEPVPVEVIVPSPVKLMILSASPDFENKFLKDWLSQNGYTVVTKTAISTNKYDRSFLNASNISFDKITPSLLDSFDVLISDESSLSALSKPEQDNIHQQVERGMGLVIRADSILLTPGWYARSFKMYGSTGKQPSHLSLSMSDITHAALPTDQPQFIRFQNGTQPLVKDSAGNIVAANVMEGAGKIVFTTINNTYSWLLAGNEHFYHTFWNTVLEKAAVQKRSPVFIETTPLLPVTGQPVTIHFSSPDDSLREAQAGDIHLSAAQNPKLNNQSEGIFWPVQSGWQQPVTVQGNAYNWYVYDKNDWQYISAMKKMNATETYVKQQAYEINTAETDKSAPVPVPPLYFLLPFIICCGFLWAERKIF